MCNGKLLLKTRLHNHRLTEIDWLPFPHGSVPQADKEAMPQILQAIARIFGAILLCFVSQLH
jgi:hypothetical protein